MQNDIKKETWLTAAQCAEQIGLTVRALRLYEEAGLVRPQRTGKNWRLYGAKEITRLNEILALKRLGLRLSDIAGLLKGHTTDLDQLLAMQHSSLQQLLERTQHSLGTIDGLRTKIADGNPPSIDELLKLAKDTNMSDMSADAVAWRRYDQARPRTERKIDPRLYADYAGHYLLDTLTYLVTERGGRLFTRLTGQAELEIFPENVDRFFYKAVQAQISFTRDETGAVSGLVLHQDGFEQTAERVEESVTIELEGALAARIREKKPVGNSEALLRQVIDQHQCGEPDYDRMTPPLEALARAQSAAIRADLERMGPLQALSFKGVSADGWDIYDARFDNGNLEWGFALATDGRFSGIYFRESF